MGPFASSTREIPATADVPGHIAVIMDGNGRWARRRLLPRVAGHRQGVETVRGMVRNCLDAGVHHLTLFAFSSENWRRPRDEVSTLMELFMRALEREVDKLHRNDVRLRVIGDRSAFEPRLQELIANGEERTAGNAALTLTIAANYGGRWDILNAVNRLLHGRPECRQGFGEDDLTPWLQLAHAPEPDLFIRTGGERRISNFCIWQLAYTELYFTDTLWPDFDATAFADALAFYRGRERRFGRTSEQLRDG